MFRRAGSSLAPHLRRLQHSKASARSTLRAAYPGAVLSSGVLAAYILWYTNTHTVHNDAASPIALGKAKQAGPSLIAGGDVGEVEGLRSVVWGSNRSNTLTPDELEVIRTPSVAGWLDGVALRDLALHRDHAACVDARGDVYQWGSGYAGADSDKRLKPTLTLREKNIVQLKLTNGRLYALSASGKVYSLASEAAKQELRPGAPTPSSDSWWGTGWFWGEDETVDFVEVTPNAHLKWGEKFISIEAGNDHVLGVTSEGRTFAHPVNKNANAYGQLGFRKFEIPDPTIHNLPNGKSHHIEVELIPKSIADPYAKSSRGIRPSTGPATSDTLASIDDTNIRFCPHFYEIPVLKGVDVAQVAAGGRSSFVRTRGGRVLAWGANEYGQLGLGSNVVLDTITVPTEVVLWKSATSRGTTTCLDIAAGGDLTAFTVERNDQSSPPTVDLLMCGNGQWGGLGGNTFSNAQGAPLRAKNVSGLLEYSDTTKSLQPIPPHAITISPTGHVLLTLNTSSDVNVGGRDLVVWGKNYESELGNGKKSSVPVPTTLETPEGGRFMLRRRKAVVKDLHGKVWKRDVNVEQRAVVGFGSSAVYWKISER
ncbi:Protein FMP25, mitochondrial [Hypsizygus marmoreus]|uniref:Protein FMP25, mitochondrial n=1 Tax=Hypsizygus marmoreus TaxID=39966 RepID=A0A369JPS2_HYPMA|nr:Protein FMP25, mitochondrial [Hypsizygus marmoreus]